MAVTGVAAAAAEIVETLAASLSFLRLALNQAGAQVKIVGFIQFLNNLKVQKIKYLRKNHGYRTHPLHHQT
jgi:hypothetical protein